MPDPLLLARQYRAPGPLWSQTDIHPATFDAVCVQSSGRARSAFAPEVAMQAARSVRDIEPGQSRAGIEYRPGCHAAPACRTGPAQGMSRVQPAPRLSFPYSGRYRSTKACRSPAPAGTHRAQLQRYPRCLRPSRTYQPAGRRRTGTSRRWYSPGLLPPPCERGWP